MQNWALLGNVRGVFCLANHFFCQNGGEEGIEDASIKKRRDKKMSSGVKRRIRSYVRVRPLLKSEVCNDSPSSLISIGTDGRSVRVAKEDVYTFDGVFDPDAPVQRLCSSCLVGPLGDVLRGFHSTLMLYGPTGSGKTFTLAQLLPTFFETLFAIVSQENEVFETTVSMECVQLYLERINDLLDPSRTGLQIREFADTGVFVKGATEQPIESMPEFLRWWKLAAQNQVVGSTKQNEVSTRGHCIVTVNITRRRRVTRQSFCADGDPVNLSCCEEEPEAGPLVTKGKFHFADLGGSERLKKSQSEGIRLAEARKINLSLAVLGNVMHALRTSSNSHVPFRDAKLTRLLQDSLRGTGSASIIVTVSPAVSCCSETKHALEFGMRAMEVVTTVTAWKEIDGKTVMMETQDWLENKVEALESKILELESAQEDGTNTGPCARCSLLQRQLDDQADSLRAYYQAYVETQQAEISKLSCLKDKMSDELAAWHGMTSSNLDGALVTLTDIERHCRQSQESCWKQHWDSLVSLASYDVDSIRRAHRIIFRLGKEAAEGKALQAKTGAAAADYSKETEVLKKTNSALQRDKALLLNQLAAQRLLAVRALQESEATTRTLLCEHVNEMRVQLKQVASALLQQATSARSSFRQALGAIEASELNERQNLEGFCSELLQDTSKMHSSLLLSVHAERTSSLANYNQVLRNHMQASQLTQRELLARQTVIDLANESLCATLAQYERSSATATSASTAERLAQHIEGCEKLRTDAIAASETAQRHCGALRALLKIQSEASVATLEEAESASRRDLSAALLGHLDAIGHCGSEAIECESRRMRDALRSNDSERLRADTIAALLKTQSEASVATLEEAESASRRDLSAALLGHLDAIGRWGSAETECMSCKISTARRCCDLEQELSVSTSRVELERKRVSLASQRRLCEGVEALEAARRATVFEAERGEVAIIFERALLSRVTAAHQRSAAESDLRLRLSEQMPRWWEGAARRMVSCCLHRSQVAVAAVQLQCQKMCSDANARSSLCAQNFLSNLCAVEESSRALLVSCHGDEIAQLANDCLEAVSAAGHLSSRANECAVVLEEKLRGTTVSLESAQIRLRDTEALLDAEKEKEDALEKRLNKELCEAKRAEGELFWKEKFWCWWNDVVGDAVSNYQQHASALLAAQKAVSGKQLGLLQKALSTASSEASRWKSCNNRLLACVQADTFEAEARGRQSTEGDSAAMWHLFQSWIGSQRRSEDYASEKNAVFQCKFAVMEQRCAFLGALYEKDKSAYDEMQNLSTSRTEELLASCAKMQVKVKQLEETLHRTGQENEQLEARATRQDESARREISALAKKLEGSESQREQLGSELEDGRRQVRSANDDRRRALAAVESLQARSVQLQAATLKDAEAHARSVIVSLSADRADLLRGVHSELVHAVHHIDSAEASTSRFSSELMAQRAITRSQELRMILMEEQRDRLARVVEQQSGLMGLMQAKVADAESCSVIQTQREREGFARSLKSGRDAQELQSAVHALLLDNETRFTAVAGEKAIFFASKAQRIVYSISPTLQKAARGFSERLLMASEGRCRELLVGSAQETFGVITEAALESKATCSRLHQAQVQLAHRHKQYDDLLVLADRAKASHDEMQNLATSRIEELLASYDKMQAKVKQLEETLHRTGQENEQLEARATRQDESARREISALVKKLEGSESQREQLGSELEDGRRQVRSANDDRRRALAAVESLQARSVQLQAATLKDAEAHARSVILSLSADRAGWLRNASNSSKEAAAQLECLKRQMAQLRINSTNAERQREEDAHKCLQLQARHDQRIGCLTELAASTFQQCESFARRELTKTYALFLKQLREDASLKLVDSTNAKRNAEELLESYEAFKRKQEEWGASTVERLSQHIEGCEKLRTDAIAASETAQRHCGALRALLKIQSEASVSTLEEAESASRRDLSVALLGHLDAISQRGSAEMDIMLRTTTAARRCCDLEQELSVSTSRRGAVELELKRVSLASQRRLCEGVEALEAARRAVVFEAERGEVAVVFEKVLLSHVTASHRRSAAECDLRLRLSEQMPQWWEGAARRMVSCCLHRSQVAVAAVQLQCQKMCGDANARSSLCAQNFLSNLCAVEESSRALLVSCHDDELIATAQHFASFSFVFSRSEVSADSWTVAALRSRCADLEYSLRNLRAESATCETEVASIDSVSPIRREDAFCASLPFVVGPGSGTEADVCFDRPFDVTVPHVISSYPNDTCKGAVRPSTFFENLVRNNSCINLASTSTVKQSCRKRKGDDSESASWVEQLGDFMLAFLQFSSEKCEFYARTLEAAASTALQSAADVLYRESFMRSRPCRTLPPPASQSEKLLPASLEPHHRRARSQERVS